VRQLCNHLPHDGTAITFRQKRRDGSNRIGIRTKRLQEKSKSLQGWKFLFQEHQLSGGQFNRLRDEQALLLDVARIQLSAELFEENPLVGGMLIDKCQPVRRGTDHITAKDLPQNIQRGKKSI